MSKKNWDREFVYFVEAEILRMQVINKRNNSSKYKYKETIRIPFINVS